jgi:hypothetical protein
MQKTSFEFIIGFVILCSLVRCKFIKKYEHRFFYRKDEAFFLKKNVEDNLKHRDLTITNMM